MSLISLAVDQIQRPSFLLDFEPANRPAEEVRGHETMAAILQALKTAGGPVSTAWLAETCGISRTTVQYGLQRLCSDHKARRSSQVIDGQPRTFWSLT